MQCFQDFPLGLRNEKWRVPRNSSNFTLRDPAISMSDATHSQTPLRASFKIKLNGGPVTIATVGQAYKFLNSLSPVEWMEYRTLHSEAKAALEAAAGNAMLNIQATAALRVLFARAKLL
jgi:hypothetical protein